MRQLSWLVILELLFLGGRCVKGQRCQNFDIGFSDRNKIPDDKFTASSFLSRDTSPYHARIGDILGEGWCAANKRNDEYLQVDMGRNYVLCGVIVQGGSFGYVESFDLEFSTDGSFFNSYSKAVTSELSHTGYKQPHKPASHGALKAYNFFQQTLLRVNEQEQEAEFHALGPYPVGRYVRLYPRTFQDFPCARLQLFGFPGPKVTCMPQYIIAEFDKAHYPDLLADGMHLKNTSCLAEDENATHILFHIPLRGCGTERIPTNDRFLQYDNEIIRRVTGVGISYKMNMFFPISCIYDRRETLGDVSFEIRVTTEAPTTTASATTLKPPQRNVSCIGWLVTLWISVSGILTLWY